VAGLEVGSEERLRTIVSRPLGRCWAAVSDPPGDVAVLDSGAVQRFIRPHRRQTNGKVERFNRTLLEEWAYVRPYTQTTADPEP
jgi:transposase InsO family protein